MRTSGNDLVGIWAVGYTSYALRSNASLVAWGSNSLGQLNIPPANDCISAAAGGYHDRVPLLSSGADGGMAASHAPSPPNPIARPQGGQFAAETSPSGHVPAPAGATTPGARPPRPTKPPSLTGRGRGRVEPPALR